MSNLLINENPLIVLPSLARAIGLNEAMVLQQVHFWVNVSDKVYDGSKWMYRTDDEWLEEFSFWSASTLRRAVARLKKLGLVRVEKLSRHFGGNSFDQKKFYTVIYSELNSIELNTSNGASGQSEQMEPVTPSQPSNDASGQNDQMEVVTTNTPSIQSDQIRTVQNDQIRSSQNDQLLTEITTEITTETCSSVSGDAHSHLFNQEQTRLISMSLDWQPTQRFAELCAAQGVNLNALDAEQQEDLLSEFRSYWSTREHKPVGQGQWEHKLVQQVKRALASRHGKRSEKSQQRAEVTGAVMNINDTDW